MKRLGCAADHEHRVLFVRPRAVRIDGDGDPVFSRFERMIEKRRRAYAEAAVVFFGNEFKLFCICVGAADGHHDLRARNRECLNDRARRGFPQPVADLIVINLRLSGLHHVLVVAQSVEQLRPVGLWIDGLQFDAVDVRIKLVLSHCATFDNTASTKQYSLGYEYNLSKRTYLYVDASRKKDIVNATTGNLAGTPTVNHYDVGVNHSF